jgi:site-specific recombinase XerD
MHSRYYFFNPHQDLEQTMRPRFEGQILRRKLIIGHNKILNVGEQKAVYDYLSGKVKGMNNKLCHPKTVNGARVLMIYQLMLSTGLRPAELCDLRLQDTPVVLGENIIMVYRGKNDKDREIPISKKLADALTGYIREVRPGTMPRHHSRSDNLRPVFYSHIKKQDTPNSLNKLFHRIGRQAGLTKELHPHMLRHTFATNTLDKGIDIYTLKQFMGHSNIAITAGYLHLTKDHLKGLGERLSPTFWD